MVKRFAFGKYFLLGIVFISCNSAQKIGYVDRKVEWLTLQEAENRMRQEPRILLIDLYTDWCYWCKVMDFKTYRNKKVAQYIDEKFYAVRVNAETKEVMEWNGRKFFYNEQNKVNDFALYLANGRLAYPTTVILPAVAAAPVVIPGYLKPADIEPVLHYFGEGVYKSQGFPEFEKNFRKHW